MNEGITEVIGSVVEKLYSPLSDLTIRVSDGHGSFIEVKNPVVTYIFGNDMYIKERLDAMTKGNLQKYPLVALFTPVIEKRDSPDYRCRAKVNILIACSSRQEWSNEIREQTSFKNILRPVYDHLLQALKDDYRFNTPYDGVIPHTYSENYSYGRYGAYTQAGEQLSEPIDAINVGNLEIELRNIKCDRRQ
ncbi:MAG: hypothetical protein K6A93_11035 [Bacteroidaceae bacterium]|nr:hypothetical protein [Bacteroidaceae bacterium]